MDLQGATGIAKYEKESEIKIKTEKKKTEGKRKLVRYKYNRCSELEEEQGIGLRSLAGMVGWD